jgi:peptide/nickel transport system ATP-binding protein
LFPNEVLGIVGESGSGKTTVSNLILRLASPSNGEILYHGQNILNFNKLDLFNFRRKVQVVFQDPYASLNPTMNIMTSYQSHGKFIRFFRQKIIQ